MLSGGTALAQIIGIATLPLVTRLYTPVEIGTVALFMAFFGFWVSTIALRYEHALMIATDDAESHVVLRLATIIVFLMSLIGPLVLWLLQQKNIFEFQILPQWAPVIAWPLFMGYGLYMLYRTWALRGGLVKKISQTAISRAIAMAATKLGFGFLGGGVLGLFMAELAGAFTSMVNLIKGTKSHYALSKPEKIEFKQVSHVGVEYKKSALIDTPSTWLNALAITLPLPMVTSLYGPEAAGWFGLARMVLSLPNAQIGAAVADVFQMTLADAIRNNERQRARNTFYMLLKKLSIIGLVPLILSITILPLIFPIIFGENWTQAGFIAASLSPWLYTAFVVSPLSRALLVLQAQEWKFFYDLLALGLLIVCYFLADLTSFSIIEFCILLSAALSLSYIAYALILYLLVESKLKNNKYNIY